MFVVKVVEHKIAFPRSIFFLFLSKTVFLIFIFLRKIHPLLYFEPNFNFILLHLFEHALKGVVVLDVFGYVTVVNRFSYRVTLRLQVSFCMKKVIVEKLVKV